LCGAPRHAFFFFLVACLGARYSVAAERRGSWPLYCLAHPSGLSRPPRQPTATNGNLAPSSVLCVRARVCMRMCVRVRRCLRVCCSCCAVCLNKVPVPRDAGGGHEHDLGRRRLHTHQRRHHHLVSTPSAPVSTLSAPRWCLCCFAFATTFWSAPRCCLYCCVFVAACNSTQI